jgi:hypothetical protein
LPENQNSNTVEQPHRTTEPQKSNPPNENENQTNNLLNHNLEPKSHITSKLQNQQLKLQNKTKVRGTRERIKGVASARSAAIGGGDAAVEAVAAQKSFPIVTPPALNTSRKRQISDFPRDATA